MKNKEYQSRVEIKRQAWEIFKALIKNKLYLESKYKVIYDLSKNILLEFYIDYTLKNEKMSLKEIECNMIKLADVENINEPTIELTDKIISEFLSKI